MKLAFLAGGDFALPALRALAAHPSFATVLVGCPVSAAAGRGMRVKPNPVALEAERLGLACRPLADERERAQALREAGIDCCVVCAYGYKLGPDSLAAPKLACLNIHASLLPRWRGAAPVERAILAGDKETGVTIQFMNERIDHGDILLQSRTAIDPDETGGSLRAKLAELGAEAIVQTLERFDTLAAQKQDPAGATRARKIAKDEARLRWSRPAAELERTVRAFNPRPGAFCILSGQRLKVLKAKCVSASGEPPGTALAAEGEGIAIACGQDALQLLVIQPAGGKPMTADAWLRGLRAPLTVDEQSGGG